LHVISKGTEKVNTLIISGGNIDCDFALDFMGKQKVDFIIAVDGGLSFTRKNKIQPDLIVGDFDSVPEKIIEQYRREQQVPIREYNPEKDATDTQIALEKALEMKSDRIWILGATGTRLDHVMGNIYILQQAQRQGSQACLVDKHNRISLVSGERVLKKKEQYGKYVSFLPLGEKASGVNLEGFKYPLKNAVLSNDSSLGVSNEIAAEEAKVSLREGTLIMIESLD
jgi:thiamine pyrophosphokinase